VLDENNDIWHRDNPNMDTTCCPFRVSLMHDLVDHRAQDQQRNDQLEIRIDVRERLMQMKRAKRNRYFFVNFESMFELLRNRVIKRIER